MTYVPFLEECTVESRGSASVPFARLVNYCGHPLFCSLVCLHVLKRFAAHHGSGARVLEWGGGLEGEQLLDSVVSAAQS